MRYFFVLAFLFASLTFGADHPRKRCLKVDAAAGTPAVRLRYFGRLFDQVQNQFARVTEHRSTGMLHLFADRTFVPEKGSIHIVGSRDNYMEWVVPLLARSDVRLTVSEPWYMKDLEKAISTAWATLEAHTDLKANAEWKPATYKEFREGVLKRVTFQDSFDATREKHSLIMWHAIPTAYWSNSGKKDLNQFFSTGEKVWFSSETIRPTDFPESWDSVLLPSPFGEYLPFDPTDPGAGGGSTFSGAMAPQQRGYLLIP